MKPFNAFSLQVKADIEEAPAGGLHISPSGGLAMVDGHMSIRQSILIILSTVPGERIMRPDFGCDLYRLTFSPNDETTAGLAIYYVKRALEKWEKRIALTRVDAGPSPNLPEVLEIHLSYRIRALLREDTATYLFDMSGKET